MSARDHREEAPGRGVSLTVHTRVTRPYRLVQHVARAIIRSWFHPTVYGAHNMPADGPVVLAPVHRSFADFSFSVMVTDRRLFFMAKDTLWESKPLGWLLVTLGAFPVHRGGVDREALAHAEEVLRRGQVLLIFPEGTRQHGAKLGQLHDGATFLAARTGASIVPMGIGGTDLAMPKGAKLPKRMTIPLVLGPPLPPPPRRSNGHVSRREIQRTTAELRDAIQAVYDEARELFSPLQPPRRRPS